MSEPLIANSNISHYRIISKIGAGGMGEVFLAEDLRLNRKVALKVLPENIAEDSERLRRFEQEARAASALNHPNILTVHEFGFEKDVHFLVTELVEGETLRETIARNELSVPDALGIAEQTAFALSAAHSAGIVHRDLKPENIMIRRDGIVKILDFGLAKLIEKKEVASDGEAETRALVKTNPGVVMGTVAYMSPEQARGKETDARTDVWSLGVLIFEMVSGKQPFAGDTTNDVIASILKSEPPLLSHYASGIPAELEKIVGKCLRKNRDERFQNVKDLQIDLKDLRQDLEFEAKLERSIVPNKTPGQTTDKSDDRQTQILETDKTIDPLKAVSTKDAIAGHSSSAEYIVGEIKQHKRGIFAGLAILFLIAAGFGYWFYANRAASNDPRQISSIAVLPFVNESGNADNEYLSDGMTESLIGSLSQIPKLNVKARSSVFRYKGKEIDLRKIAQDLNVQALLYGRLVQRGEQLILNLELVDAGTENILWAEQYNRKQTDLVSLQTEITRDVSNKLRMKFSGEEEKRLAKNYTENGESYQLYLKGRFHFNKFSESGFRKGIEFFNQAIAIDPNYALAYSGLADCYFGLSDQYEPPREVMPKARAAAEKALQLDDSLAEAHVSLGLVKMFHDWEWAEAESRFQRAIALNPNYGNAHFFYARYLAWNGRFDEAVKEIELAVQIEPLSVTFNSNLGYFLLLANRTDEAVRHLEKNIDLELSSHASRSYLALSYLKQGELEKAVSENEKVAQADNSARYLGGLGYVYAFAGQRDKALRVLEQLNKMKERQYVSSYYFAVVYSGLNEKDQAFAYLDKAFSERSDALTSIKVNPWFDNLRTDPRFQDLLRRMNLPQ